jgi:hypothetical protein
MLRDAEKAGYFDAHRVTCLHCGYAQDWISPLERKARSRPQWQ